MPEFYKNYGPGVVVSTAINRFVYVTLNEKFDGKVSVRYSAHENVDKVFELRHALIREALLDYGVKDGVEVVIASEVPARGSGLGASSAMLVALCLALEHYQGRGRGVSADGIERSQLAERAARIEIEKAGSPIGKQDHYAAAWGGLKKYLFRQNSDGCAEVTPFDEEDFIKEIEGQSMLFYLNMEHDYKDNHVISWILKDQLAQVHEKRKSHELQRDNAVNLWENMRYEVPERFIDHVNENWRIKRGLHEKITNTVIDRCVQRAYAAGATAAKVCGAGGGGFIYFMVPPAMQGTVREALSDLSELRFGFCKTGAELVFEDKRHYVVAPTA